MTRSGHLNHSFYFLESLEDQTESNGTGEREMERDSVNIFLNISKKNIYNCDLSLLTLKKNKVNHHIILRHMP